MQGEGFVFDAAAIGRTKTEKLLDERLQAQAVVVEDASDRCGFLRLQLAGLNLQ